MVITLTTDFGYQDPFVGIMKGVIASINAEARIIDLSHGVAPQDIMSAALILRYSAAHFPQGSIHVAVVDPGVGSARRPILIEAARNYFIGPDNGVLSLALGDEEPRRVIQLSNAAYHRQPVSATFHGRDIFAPAAAHLSLGVDAAALGTRVQDFTRIPWPKSERFPSEVRGEIIYIDIFGNLISSISEHEIEALPGSQVAVRLGDVLINGLAPNYAAGGSDNYVALINSWGLLEVAIYRGNAQRRCGARLGDKIRIGALDLGEG
jgi:S-adenosylmethionine hydrolase